MKNIKPLTWIIFTAFFAAQAHAVTIGQWTFENNPPSALSDSSTISGIAADVGNGNASGVHASALTDWTIFLGNGSANSLVANEWAVGDYWQFHLSSTGFKDLSLSWDQVSTAKGPGIFALFWGLNDSSFTQLGDNYLVPQPSGGWGSYSFDLSSLSLLNDSSDVFFRLVNMSTLGSSGEANIVPKGTHHIDNFLVTGTKIVSTSRVPDSLPFAFTACFLFGFLTISRQMTKLPKLSSRKIR